MGTPLPRLTPQLCAVLEAMLAEPTAGHYGFSIMKAASIQSGTLYPLLARLEQAEWVTSDWETASPTELGRPRRRVYRLTGIGTQCARNVLTVSSEPASGRRIAKLAFP